jgi:hypothetical protein
MMRVGLLLIGAFLLHGISLFSQNYGQVYFGEGERQAKSVGAIFIDDDGVLISTSDLLSIETIATDSSTYSGLASAMYYKATGIRLIPQWDTSPEQRSIGASHSIRVKNSLTLFPNPANDELNIVFDTPQSPQEYQIINQLGEIMREGTLSGDHVSLEGLNGGLYLIRVGDQAKRFVKL